MEKNMWQNFIAKNFRCFTSTLLQPLARINLIAGKNNAGKTALLEAMHMHSYPQDCALPFMLKDQRGMKDFPQFSDEIGAWLFFDRHTTHGLELISQDDKGKTRCLRIWLLDGVETNKRFPDLERMLQGSFIEQIRQPGLPRIIMETQADGKKTHAVGVVNKTGLSAIGSAKPWDGPCVFLPAGGVSMETDTRSFSDLEKARKHAQLTAALKILEPRLQGLSLLLLEGSPVIHGDVGLRQPVPITMMGEGVRRLTSILLGVSRAEGGRVLVDEIENGFHYSVMKKVWQAIAHAAQAADVQVFATTHSWECIRWAHEAFADNETYDFRLHRLDRGEQDVPAPSYDRERIESALFNAVEMR
jgi:hypothetical protein